jgi:hypothetical protein
MEGIVSITAPVLAGFSLALVGIIAQDPAHFRWPGATLVALIVTIFCMIDTIRIWAATRNTPEMESFSDSSLSAADLILEQGRNRVRYRKRVLGISLRWGVGICSLWACIAMTAAPPVSGGRETAFRWVAFALAIAAGMWQAARSRLTVRNARAALRTVVTENRAG